MTGAAFERYLGVDWSGAEGEFHRGIQVAEFFAPTRTLRLLHPQEGSYWSRQAVLDFIKGQTDHRTLIGLDFCFSLPWSDDLADFPMCLREMREVRDLWAFVDSFCATQPFFYAGPIWSSNKSPFRPFIKHRSGPASHEGHLFNGGRFRKTEIAARKLNVRPILVYRMVGPQVGTASFAGMRFLHALAGSPPKKIAIWPFDEIRQAKLALCEVYPSLFYRVAGSSRPSERQVRIGAHIDHIADVFRFFNVQYALKGDESVDAIDALVIAAALPAIAEHVDSFAALDDPIVGGKEGWIVGVPVGGVQ